MTVTVEELERLKAFTDADDQLQPWTDEDGDKCLVLTWADTHPSVREILALAIHGLNCQAAGITAERLGDIQMVPVIDMDEVRA